MDELTVRDDREFRKFVRDKLEELTVQGVETNSEVKNLVGRLDTLNGSVARHERAINDVREREKVRDAELKAAELLRQSEIAAAHKLAAAEHRAAKELADAKSAAEAKQAAAMEKQAAKFWRWITPAIKYLAFAILILIADHFQEIMKAWGLAHK